jgi:putative spermidine/putrescine transport system permease protein
MRSGALSRLGASTFVVLLSLFLVVPVLIIVPASFSAGEQLMFPPEDYSWRWYVRLITDERWQVSAWVSLKIALGAVALSVPVALAAAMASVRFGVVSATQRLYLLLPLVVPHSVVATGLFTVLLHLGLLETEWVLAVVHAAFALPLALLLFISALQAIDPLVWSAAATLGASPRQVLLRVILRTIWPSVLSAALLVFIFSWDEVVAAVFIGPVAPATLPALMFSYLLETVTPAVAAVASVLLIISIAVGLAMLALSARKR